MTYEATVEFKFDATYTHDYTRGFGSTIGDEDFLPEEHFLITAPAADLNARQYFKLFEKFMLCVGMSPCSIRSGAMSLVFNDMVLEEEQRKVCKEYELTMDEDLQDKFEEWKIRDAEVERLMNSKKGPMGTVLDDAWEITDPHGTTTVTDRNTSNDPTWEERYWSLYRRFQRFVQYSDEDLEEMIDMYDRSKLNGVV